MAKRKKKHCPFAKPRSRYLSTPIPGLFLHTTFLLLNLLVCTADDNAKTDGLILPEIVDTITAFIRHAYDFPDLDLAQGKGVLISLIGQFLHPDDYVEHRVAEMHTRVILNALTGDLKPQAWVNPDLRTSNIADLAQGRERALAFYYKQRFLSFCFVGEKAELDKLRGNISSELLGQILGTLWQGVELSQEAFVTPHPTFVPSGHVRKVSQQNAVEWARQSERIMSEIAKSGTPAEISVTGPPGPSYTLRFDAGQDES